MFKNEEKHIVRITYLCIVEEGESILSNEHTHMEWIPKEKVRALEMKDKLLKKVIEEYF